MAELRLDKGRVKSWEKLHDGRLRVKATVSRAGDLEYRYPDGSKQIETLTSEELFNVDSLDTAGLAAVTLGHPSEGLVTPQNYKRFNVGAAGSQVFARKDQGLVDIVFVIGDEEAIKAVENGVREVSAGYLAEVKQDGDRFFQRNRRYNHFALVDEGRAGPSVRLHLDAVECPCIVQVEAEDNSEENPMKEYKGISMPDEAYKIVMDMEEEMNSLRSDMEKMKADMEHGQRQDRTDAAHVSDLSTRLAEATAKVDVLEAQVQTLKADSAVKLDSSEIEAGVNAWKTAYMQASPYLERADSIKAGDNVTTIYEKAIAASNPSLQPKLDSAKERMGDRYETYVAAMFDTLPAPKVNVDSRSGRSSEYDRAMARAVVGGDRDGASLERADEEDEAKARNDAIDAYKERVRNAYKGLAGVRN